LRPCILLVDDDASVRRSLVRLLRAHDYDVLEADNAVLALQILASTRPAAIVMDMIMPGEDALGAARKIKADPRMAVPMIALTASPPTAPADRALFAAIVGKPSDAHVLLDAIERVLHNNASPPSG